MKEFQFICSIPLKVCRKLLKKKLVNILQARPNYTKYILKFNLKSMYYYLKTIAC